MQKTLRIIEILFGVLVVLPVFVMTVYNLYRQEVNPSAPPLINILPDWHWAVWLSILLLVCLIVVILEFYRSQQNQKTNTANNSTVIKAEDSGLAVGGDFIQTNYISSTPQRIAPMASNNVTGNVGLLHITPIKDDKGNELEFKFTIINDTNTDFHKCAVYIDEIAYKPKTSKRWIPLSDLPSEKTLKWDAFVPDLEGLAEIKRGRRKSFILAQAKTIVLGRGDLGYNYDLIFHEDYAKLPEEDAPSHRILIRFHGAPFLGDGIDNMFYIFLEGEPNFKKFKTVAEYT